MVRRGPLTKLKLKEKNKKKEKGERKRKIKKRKIGERRERERGGGGGGGGGRAPTSLYDVLRSGDRRLTGNGLKSEYAARTTRGY